MHCRRHLIVFGLALACSSLAFGGEFLGERPHVGFAAPALNLPALNPDAARDLISSRDVNIDHLCGASPHKDVPLCVVIFSEDSSLAAVQKLHKRYQKKGVAVVVVAPGAGFDSPMADASKGLPFPVLADSHRIVTERWGVTKTPSFFLLNRDGTVRLEGEFDLAAQNDFATDFIDTVLSEDAGK